LRLIAAHCPAAEIFNQSALVDAFAQQPLRLHSNRRQHAPRERMARELQGVDAGQIEDL
jgi:hypothetical protein